MEEEGEEPAFIVPIEDAIDLHSFAPRDVADAAEAYLQAAHDAGFTEVRLIHGRGKGVQRAAIHRLLRDNPLVELFWDAAESHLGATIVRLRRRADA